MIHLPHLITDLGFILIIAALSTLLFKKLGQPLVLGYLIAGFLVSPHVPFFPTVTDVDSIKVWSEIGVIFLLFSLGLEFSFKKLFKVGGSAGFTAVFEVLFMLGLGYGFGTMMGWNHIDSLFFGGILSVSSTTIIVRAFQEMGLKGQKFVEVVFGILVVEDILAILLLVLLAAVAGSEVVSTAHLLTSGLRLIFYIALWFVVGIFFIPLFLRKIRPLLEDETVLLVAMGLCFLMVMVAAGVGFSPALGAFVMGSLLAETPEGHRMESLLQPVKNLFAAIFFVSVGMMIDPNVLLGNGGLVVTVTLVTIVGKFISTFLGALLSGQTRKQSFQAGMSLAQIGEFSFIIASLGVSLKVTSDFLYPLAIAVSAVTTFTTPYLIKWALPLSQRMEGLLPEAVRRGLDSYHAALNRGSSNSNSARVIFKFYGGKIFLNSVVVIAMLSFFQILVRDKIENFIGNAAWVASSGAFVLCLLLCAPFMWGLLMSPPSLKEERDLNEIRVLNRLQVGIFIGRFVLFIGLLFAAMVQFFTLKETPFLLILALTFVGLFFVAVAKKIYGKIEANFLNNLTENEKKIVSETQMTQALLPWDVHLENFELTADMDFIGKSLRDVKFKEHFGVTVAAVFRGSKKFFAPAGGFVLWPQDRLICFGSQEQLTQFNKVVEAQKANRGELDFSQYHPEKNYRLVSFSVDSNSKLIGKTISDSGIKELFKGLVVGIERNSQKILGPSGSFVLNEFDLLWIVAEKNQSDVS